MLIRICDIAKKFGIESKEVLAKAKELGISSAKVPSSSLDKLTAQFIEQELLNPSPKVIRLNSPLEPQRNENVSPTHETEQIKPVQTLPAWVRKSIAQKSTPATTNFKLNSESLKPKPAWLIRRMQATINPKLSSENPSITVFKSTEMKREPLALKLKAQHSKYAQVEADILALLAKGESEFLEFKSTALGSSKDKKISKNVIKTVTAFLNSKGGTLLIGIANDRTILGLEHDYKELSQKRNRDGYELFLRGSLMSKLGGDLSPQIHIAFQTISGKEVCRIDVEPSPREVYMDEQEHLFIRNGNSSEPLSTKEAIQYSKNRWKQLPQPARWA